MQIILGSSFTARRSKTEGPEDTIQTKTVVILTTETRKLIEAVIIRMEVRAAIKIQTEG